MRLLIDECLPKRVFGGFDPFLEDDFYLGEPSLDSGTV